MKILPWILVVLLLVACLATYFCPCESLPAEIRTETKVKTIVKIDTVLISAPIAAFFRVTGETIRIGDTVVQREQVVYVDSFYRAVVGGYHPMLDSIEVYPRTVTKEVTNDVYHTITPKKKRWGLGLQAGYGYPGGMYAGIGVSYNLFSW